MPKPSWIPEKTYAKSKRGSGKSRHARKPAELRGLGPLDAAVARVAKKADSGHRAMSDPQTTDYPVVSITPCREYDRMTHRMIPVNSVTCPNRKCKKSHNVKGPGQTTCTYCHAIFIAVA